jgi:hypothetical protein
LKQHLRTGREAIHKAKSLGTVISKQHSRVFLQQQRFSFQIYEGAQIMQFVPSLPPPISPVSPEEVEEVNKLSEAKKVKNVLEQPTSPPTTRLHARHEPPANPGNPPETAEKRHAENDLAERRLFCRRIRHLPILDELRSEIDRRQRKQREGDAPEHIDEKA